MKVGRNEPCPCGSGKKYKRCHLLVLRTGVARARKAADRANNQRFIDARRELRAKRGAGTTEVTIEVRELQDAAAQVTFAT